MLDIEFTRSQFPAFDQPSDSSFFENAGGSFPVRHTVEALAHWYPKKVQPYSPFAGSRDLGVAMDTSRSRWAEALGVAVGEVMFGPSTSANTYVLSHALSALINPGDEVIVTNQDHEANTGALRRMAERTGATLLEWGIDPDTGQLEPDDLANLISERTALISFPHCSNIVGQENDVARITAMARAVGARTIVDGVSFVPHGIPDVGALGADVYLFSLYKVYSVHQGLMVVRSEFLDKLPNQGHYFNAGYPEKKLTPAGPDHVQEACAGAVLDYIEASHAHHGGTGDLYAACRAVSKLWQAHETELLNPVLAYLEDRPDVRLIGPSASALHRCPTVAFVPERGPSEVIETLIANGVHTNFGNFYAVRVLEALGVDPDVGVVRVSWVHYSSQEDIARLLTGLDRALG